MALGCFFLSSPSRQHFQCPARTSGKVLFPCKVLAETSPRSFSSQLCDVMDEKESLNILSFFFLNPKGKGTPLYLDPASKDGNRNAPVFSLKQKVKSDVIKCAIFGNWK